MSVNKQLYRETLDKVVNHLRTQGKKCIWISKAGFPHSVNKCGTLSCAIGYLMGDKVVDGYLPFIKSLSGNVMQQELDSVFTDMGFTADEDGYFLREIQAIHDQAREEHFVTDVNRLAKVLSDRYGLHNE